ncbi:DNA repair protein RecO [Oceanithermus sp.]
MERYRTHEGVIVGRKLLPGGDVILRLVGPEGSTDVVARKAQRPGGRSGRLMLFHHISYQAYHKPERDLATLTQAELVGRLEGLSQPQRYPAAAYLAELAYRLAAPEVARPIWAIFTSGLRGIASHEEPGVPLVWSGWRLVAAAGLAPRLVSRCGHPPSYLELEGSLACAACATSPAVSLGPGGTDLLAAIIRQPGKKAIVEIEKGRWSLLLIALIRYVAYQLEPLKSEAALLSSISGR